MGLVHELPDCGVVVALSGTLPPDLRPTPGRFLIDVVADGLPHPAAQRHLVQNRAHAQRLPWSDFIPHWPQPRLVPRVETRGDRFENLRFYGDRPNLDPRLADRAFAEKVRESFGLVMECVPAERWHDYSDTDCVLGVRQLSRKPFLSKPATKLTNAWLAGVPFLGGADSAFRSEGRPGTNYLACQSEEEVLHALERLKTEPNLRRRIVAEGRRASEPFRCEVLAKSWEDYLRVAVHIHSPAWQVLSSSSRSLGFLVHRAALVCDRVLLR